jgi:hypothetical protein
MALGLYREVSAGAYASYKDYDVDDDKLPIITTHDGELGEVVESKLFVQADTAVEYYTHIRVTPVVRYGDDDVSGTVTGHGVKLRVGAAQPTESEWSATDYGDYIDITQIGSALGGDIAAARPFWCRIECPAGASADNKENVVLRLSFTAEVVP